MLKRCQNDGRLESSCVQRSLLLRQTPLKTALWDFYTTDVLSAAK